MTPREQKSRANIHVRCTEEEKEMLRRLCEHEHRSETAQVLHWVHREYAKVFGNDR